MSTSLHALVDAGVDALLPSTCVACGEASGAAILCARCASAVESASDGSTPCASAFLYGGPIAEAIRIAKFGPDAAVAEALGRLWVERAIAGLVALPDDVDGVAFVPAPYRRRVVRGFDLPAVLALALAKHLRVEIVDALACVRTDEPLSFGADKATRALKVAGRYGVRRTVGGSARRLLLVDDVQTTGATLLEASRVLTAAGHHVVAAAFAVAP